MMFMLSRPSIAILLIQTCFAFQSPIRETNPYRRIALLATPDKNSGPEEYRNAATSILSNFMQNKAQMKKEDPLAKIDFSAPKLANVALETLAVMLDSELYAKEWFVTGNVNPSYFSDEFEFQDPDVKLKGIEEYARGVYKLFDQETSRAEIISVVVNETIPRTITVTWRLSGKVNIGPGLTIKPYICYTDFKVNDEGLISFQEDRFSIPGWDILLSALFPFLIGKLTSPAAAPVEPRPIPMMPVPVATKDFLSPFQNLLEFFK